MQLSLFKRRPTNKYADLERFVDEYEVPSFPGAINDILGKIRHEDSSNADIAQDLESDPGMSVRILRLVNSAGFGLRHRVEDVSQAVQLVGRSSLESILISLAMKETLPNKARPGFDPIAFWRTSAQRAAIAGRMAARLSPPDRSLCWTAAMLQDIAIPLLVDHLGDRYCEILTARSEGNDELDILERAEIGFDHADLGRRICEVWELPERLTKEIAEHHAPPTLETAPFRLVSLIRMGERDGGSEPEGLSEMIDAATKIGLDPETSSAQIQDGLRDAAETNGML